MLWHHFASELRAIDDLSRSVANLARAKLDNGNNRLFRS
jgi:hypothetical protein